MGWKWGFNFQRSLTIYTEKKMKLEKLLGEVFSVNNSEKKRSEKNQNAYDRYHAKRIAKKLNITIEVTRDPCGWCAWILADELEGDGQFVTSWAEAHANLYSVEVMRTEK